MFRCFASRLGSRVSIIDGGRCQTTHQPFTATNGPFSCSFAAKYTCLAPLLLPVAVRVDAPVGSSAIFLNSSNILKRYFHCREFNNNNSPLCRMLERSASTYSYFGREIMAMIHQSQIPNILAIHRIIHAHIRMC